MKTFKLSLVVASTFAALCSLAEANQPPDVVKSDAFDNTAMGTNALLSNAPVAFAQGLDNTAAGFYALTKNTAGNDNTAFGSYALWQNSSGDSNAASGAYALAGNTTGFQNTAVGAEALNSNTDGSNNTAVGAYALGTNYVGSENTATGSSALSNNSGSQNTATGFNALQANLLGNRNTALGNQALNNNGSGSNNTAVGNDAGFNLTTGSNNIDIGNGGVAGESGTIRIGTVGKHTATAIAGIYGTSISGGVAVIINSKGKLGVATSSRRYKDDIRTMGESSDGLYKLHPVAFRYKEPEANGEKPVQYGLIAEEVAKVYPELVFRDDDGTILGVRYDELAPLLLNQMQRQRAQMTQKIDSQAAKIASLEQQLAGIQVALSKLQPKDQLVAQR
jgi:hypothetical protein